MSRKPVKAIPVKSKGWFGTWHDGTLGWAGPEHLHNRDAKYVAACPYDRDYVRREDEYYLCEVIIKPIRDKKGRLIKRRASTLKACRQG